MAQPLESYVAEWERAQRVRQSDALTPTREEALHRFLSRGFPTTHEEEWRFTSVRPITEQRFTLAPAATDTAAGPTEAFTLAIAPAAQLVFINGRHAPALSRLETLPRGTRVESLASALATAPNGKPPHLTSVAPFDGRPFVALNTAFLEDGATIELPAGTILKQPIHLLFLSTGGANGRPFMSHPRVLVVLGENSQATIVETYAGPSRAPYFTNAVAEVVLGANAVLDHYKLQHEGADACHIGATHIRAERSAVYASHSLSLGGALVRNDLVAVLDGEGVECTLNGLYVADAQRLVDNHTTIDHVKPHCGSREIYKGILAERARGVFNGKIIVRPDAQKTDAKQTNRALLLSEDAQINTKPQLEIFANDVKCTHGAAVGQLDDEALFYLRSRGLGDEEARRLLIYAFAADVLNRFPLEPIRVDIESRLQRQLRQALPAAA